MKEVVEPLEQRHSAHARCLGYSTRFHRVARKRFLRQHVLAGLNGGEIPRSVQAVGQRVVDDVHLRIRDQLGVRTDHPFDPMLGRIGSGPLGAACGNGHQAVPGGRCRFDHRVLGDA